MRLEAMRARKECLNKRIERQLQNQAVPTSRSFEKQEAKLVKETKNWRLESEENQATVAFQYPRKKTFQEREFNCGESC